MSILEPNRLLGIDIIGINTPLLEITTYWVKGLEFNRAFSIVRMCDNLRINVKRVHEFSQIVKSAQVNLSLNSNCVLRKIIITTVH